LSLYKIKKKANQIRKEAIDRLKRQFGKNELKIRQTSGKK
jgi:hypothetical protein